MTIRRPADWQLVEAIEAHRVALRAYYRAIRDSRPEREQLRLANLEYRLWKRLIGIKPTTAAGAIALARYACRNRQITCDAVEWEIRSVLKVLRHIGDMQLEGRS